MGVNTACRGLFGGYERPAKIAEGGVRAEGLRRKVERNRGIVLLEMKAETLEEAVRELASSIPPESVPSFSQLCDLAGTHLASDVVDAANGVAIPYLRCPGAKRPIIVIGRSTEGIRLRPEVETPTHLFFFVVTPAERPHAQSFFVQGMTTIARSEVVRGRLLSAETPVQVFEIIAAADPALTG